MNKKTSIALRIIIIVLLFLAVLELPYGFYTFLRWVVTIVMVLSAIKSFENNFGFFGIVFCGIGLLFNPLVPVYLDKETWTVIDIIIGVLLIVTLFIKKTHPAKE
jgi:hypothetical protein